MCCVLTTSQDGECKKWEFFCKALRVNLPRPLDCIFHFFQNVNFRVELHLKVLLILLLSPHLPATSWDTSHIPGDCGTILKVQHVSCMHSRETAVKHQEVTVGFPNPRRKHQGPDDHRRTSLDEGSTGSLCW